MPILRNTALISLLLGSCLLGSVATSRADQWSDCEKRIHKAEENLHNEIRKHGEHSRQADNRRRELEQARYGCRGYETDHHRYHDRDRDRRY
jgi:hypothetical protein